MPEGSRSPNYPAVQLDDALKAIGKLWIAEKRTPVSNETAARHFGYKGLTGPARVMIGALRQYGLIAKTESGRFKVSEVAIRAIVGTPEDQAAAKREAALNPPLFQDLAKDHRDASEAAVVSYLVTKKEFIESGAKNAAKAFRAAMAIATPDGSGYNQEKNGSKTEDKSAESEDWPMADAQPDQRTAAPAASGTGLPPMSWVLSVPRGIRAELRISGKDIRSEDLKRLKQQIDFLVESFEETN